MRELLGRRDFRRLLVGQTVSALGDWVGTVGLMVLVLQATGSATAVGGVLVLRLAPAAVAGPLAARSVARIDRRRTMLAADAARVGMAAALPFLPHVWWAAPGWLPRLAWIYLWAFLIEAAGLVFLPARDAAVPDLAGGDEGGDLGVANGLVLASSYGMIPVGAAAFGGLMVVAEWFGLRGEQRYVVPFLLDAATYVVSYAAIARISDMGSRTRAGAAVAAEPAPSRFRDALRVPLVRMVLPATCAVALGVGALFSVGVVFVEDVLAASPTEFGVLIALFGVGAGGGLALSRLAVDRIRQVRVGIAAQGVVIAAMALAPTIGLAYAGAVMFGSAATATLVAGMTLLQDRLTGGDRDLAFTAFHVVVRTGLAVAAILAGVAGDLLSRVDWPVVGHLAAARVVLFAAGVVVLGSATAVRASSVTRET